jgi:hypothetical protein
MIELDLNEATIYTDSVIDELTYSNMVYNVEECGMSWDALATLFGEDSVQAAQARYEMQEGLD